MNYAPETVAPGGVVNVYVWTDFVCPFCLLGEGFVKKAVAGLSAKMIWMPFELRPYPLPTLRPEGDYLPREWKNSVYPMAERLGVPMKLPTISPQPYTRKAFIGMQYAGDHGLASQYTEAVLRAFFLDNKDVGDTGVLREISAGVGLDPDAYVAALDDEALAARHGAALRLANQLGVRAVPTLLIGEEMISGATEDVEGLREMIRRARVNLLN